MTISLGFSALVVSDCCVALHYIFVSACGTFATRYITLFPWGTKLNSVTNRKFLIHDSALDMWQSLSLGLRIKIMIIGSRFLEISHWILTRLRVDE
jgi:hypothetical protein